MLFVTHAILVAVVTLMVLLYFYHYIKVVNNTVQGQVIDVTYLRIYILGCILLITGCVIVTTPFVSFLLDVSWLDLGIVVLSCLLCILLGLAMILRIEKEATQLEDSRQPNERHLHSNKNYVRQTRLVILVGMVITGCVPYITLVLSDQPLILNYSMTLMVDCFILYIVYFPLLSDIKQMKADEYEIRVQLEKNDTRSEKEQQLEGGILDDGKP